MQSTRFIDNCTTKHCLDTNVSQANDSLAPSVEGKEMALGEILKLAFEVLVALVGVVGNTLVIIVISSLVKRKKPGDLYLLNLAIADLGTLLFAYSLAAIRQKAPYNWPFGEFTCLYLYAVPEIFYGASVWYIAVIAIERYQTIVTVKTPGRNNKNTSLRKAKLVAACVWVMSFLFYCLPFYFVVKYRDYPNGGKWCGPVFPSLLVVVYSVSLTLVSYILPLIAICFTYVAISRVLKQSNLFIKAVKQERMDKIQDEQLSFATNVKSVRLQQNKRAKKIITPVVLVFAITMLPLNILRLVVAFWPAIATQEYYAHLFYVVSVSTVLHSSANPVVYSLVSRDFRKGINNLCRRPRRIGVQSL